MISDIELSIPQSLTPDSSNDDTTSDEPSTPVLNDALSIVMEPTSFISFKWCQRCGTLETPRWRNGPSGSATLCNACGLKWKTRGKPKEGYSSNVFPPLHQVEVKTKRKRNTKKQIPAKKPRVSNRVLCDSKETNSKKQQPSKIPKEKVVPEEKVIQDVVPEEDNKENAIHCCEHCQKIDTPLWRKGPSGPKSLCNACGLQWAKTQPTTRTTLQKTLGTPKKKKLQHILLFNRKEFVKQGLYYDATRTTSTFSFSFDLPIHQGEFLISKETEFELPPYIHQERELGKVKAISTTRVPFFSRIRSNIFVERKPQSSLKDPLVCICKPPPPDKMGCGDDCINRMMFYECDPKQCPCGEQCSNQRFQRKEQSHKKLQVYHTEQRGWGLRTLTDIKKGEYVIEYRGEIISQKECEERMCTTYVNEKNFYFLDYHNGEVIDATAKGTEARFINHSCDPNCHIEKWSCKGESNFGVFASKDIKANSELFYDYNFSTFNGSVESHQMCHCGSENCRGLIGRKVRAK